MAGIKNQYRAKTLWMVGIGRSTEFFPTRHAKHAILRHADPVPNVQNHVTSPNYKVTKIYITQSHLKLNLIKICMLFLQNIATIVRALQTKILLTNGLKKRAISAGKGAFDFNYTTATAGSLHITIWSSTKMGILRMNY